MNKNIYIYTRLDTHKFDLLVLGVKRVYPVWSTCRRHRTVWPFLLGRWWFRLRSEQSGLFVLREVVGARNEEEVCECVWFALENRSVRVVGGPGKIKTHVIDSPFHLVCEHGVHVRDDLNRHVDQALAEDETNMGVGLRKEGLEGSVERVVGSRSFFEGVIRDSFY